MTLLIKIGRRLPRTWFQRTAHLAGGLLSFQTNLWEMINSSFSLAKRKATASNTGVQIIIKKDSEIEDLHYFIEWLFITVRGTKEQELEEHKEAQMMYSKFKNVFGKKEFIKDPELGKHFKSKLLGGIQVEEAYKKGYGDVSENSIANKMLEIGILTHMELLEDWDTRIDLPSK
jgi:hypothetical protein